MPSQPSTTIYKHPYGIHIDLSKIITVSKPEIFSMPTYQDKGLVGYEIVAQLQNKPLPLMREIRKDEIGNLGLPGEIENGGWFFRLAKELSETEKELIVNCWEDWQRYFLSSVCYQNILAEIDEFIKVWRERKIE